MFYADSLGFFDAPMKKQVADQEIKLDLVHMTAAMPLLKTMLQVMVETTEFKGSLRNQSRPIYIIERASELDGNQCIDCICVILGLQNTPEDVDVRKF